MKIERILLSRAGGGSGPVKPGNLHELFHDMRWCQPDARGKPLNDKSERLRSHYSFPHV